MKEESGGSQRYPLILYRYFCQRWKRGSRNYDCSFAILGLIKDLGINEFLGFSPELDIAKVRKILGSEMCLNGKEVDNRELYSDILGRK